MVLVVKCLICNKELKYTHNDSSELILHVRTEHPLVSKEARESAEGRRDQEKSLVDLDLGLRQNSESLKKLIDQQIQTDIDWRHFRMFTQGETREIPLSEEIKI